MKRSRTPVLILLAITAVLAAPPLLRSSGLSGSSDRPTQSTASSAPQASTPAQRPPGTAGASVAGQLKQSAPAGSGTPPPTTTPTTARTSTATLPFDLPAGLATSKRLAFAHYFTPFPISIDNKVPSADYYTRNYLDPHGESGQHLAYGGLLRDRPIGRAPLSGDYQLQDFKTEVRQARAAGLDGFAVDILSLTSYHWDRVKLLLDAAHQADPTFKILLMPDMTTLDDETPAALAAAIDTLGRYPAAFHLANGRLVVSPFKAEAKTTTWWAGWLSLMKSSHATTVAFVPTLLDLKRYAVDFAPISYGLSEWGLSSPATNQNGVAHAALVHGLGKIFMAPAKVQDERPSQGQYQEAANTETLRLSWQAVIDGGAEWVDMPTWNDYSEGTQIAPSAQHGWSYLDISSYYLSRWKTGTTPPIRRDGVYLTHRNQLLGARPVTVSTKPMVLRAGSTPARDTVEVLAFLTRPAAVVVRIGDATYTWKAPAGVSAHTFPLRTGQVSVRVRRGGNVVTSVVSPYGVLARPPVQDLQYDAVSSLRR